MKLGIIRDRNLWLHLSFWCVYLSFNIYQLSFFQRKTEAVNWDIAWLMIGIHFVLTLAMAYLNYFVLLPRFLEKKSWPRYIAEFIVPFVIIVTLRVIIQRSLADELGHRERYFYSSMFVIQTAAITLFITIFISLLRFVSEWFQLESIRREMQNEKLTAELNFLKAQINPHFLFNTLNNLYYLAYSKSENTTEVIAKLSQVMRYMIYDSNHERVLLSKEIEYMQNYIDLERLRLNNQIPINFKLSGNIETAVVAPLILITFLENAFKHGVTTNAKAWVNISIAVSDHVLVYAVENSKIEKAAIDNGGKSGIGLANVRRRLELVYPGQYELKVEDHPERYYIELRLKLQ
jgi:two-component system, LytTR family, sensor histidine kinase AlgZ